MHTSFRMRISLYPMIILLLLISCKSGDYKSNLLIFKDTDGKIKPIKDEKEWYIRRAQILDSIQLVMGPLPDRAQKVPLDVKVESESEIDGIIRRRISFAVEKEDRVPAFLFIPSNHRKPVPGILCLHQTIKIGKEEPAGMGGSPNLDYALELARRGYVTLAPDYPNFGEYSFDPYANGYASASMKGIWNNMAAVDLLQSLKEVDSSRIGCIGHSLGGHNSLFLAVFDTRVKAVVTSCGFTSFLRYYGGDLTGWSHKGYMPRIASLYGKDPSRMPFDFTEIIGAIAPRALFINAPLKDSNFDITGVYDCVNSAKPVYHLLKADNMMVMTNPDAPHDFPDEARESAYLFLDTELGIGQFVPNYDESKVPAYTLPDPLTFTDSSKVKSAGDWEKRRAELYTIFEHEVYGVSPKWDGKMTESEISTDIHALKDKAIRKEVLIRLRNGDKELDFTLLVYLPHSDRPVPVFLGYNFGGNHSVTNEKGISITSSWMRNDPEDGVTGNKASEKGRGSAASQWQVDEIIARGYGLVTLYYGDIDPDYDDGFKNGVHGLYDVKRDSASWGSIAGWAWGLSRVMDWIVKTPTIDSKGVMVIGHSRLGKAALWAGASDKRFAVVVSNNSGCGGAALSKRIYGETVGRINTSFPHWFCRNFSKYNEMESLLPVDQHELLALMAPRPVYVASAEEDKWADPVGEFLSCLHASPVYTLLGLTGFPAKSMPRVNTPVTGGEIGYHVRTGGHDVKLYDWKRYLDFADYQFKKR